MVVKSQNSAKKYRNKFLFGLVSGLAVLAIFLETTQAKILAEVTYNYGIGSTQTRQVLFDNQDQINSLLASGTATVKKIRDVPDNLSKEEYDRITNDVNNYNQQQDRLDTNNASSSLWSIANWLPDKILRVLLAIIYIILWLFYSITYGLVYLAESILKLVIDPTIIKALGGLSTAEFVKNVAQTLANLCNIFYLLFLLYIAFMTIIGKVDTWRLLFKLVMAALLTNFGLVLAGAIIDVSQVIMYSIFTPDKIQAGFSPGTEILQTIQDKLKIGSTSLSGLYDLASKIFGWDKTGELLKDVLNMIFLIFVALALVVTLLTVALILMVRIIALWIILILSPIAFLFYVLPQTEKWWDEWLENLFKYAFTGPILVFFLWLAKKIAENFKNIEELNRLGNNLPNQNDLKYAFYALVAQNFSSFFQMLILVVVIWAGILIANKFRIYSAPGIDRLIGSTKRLGLGALSAIGLAGKGIKAGSWSISGIRQKLRDRKIEKTRSEMGALKAEGKHNAAAVKENEVKALEEKNKQAKESKEKWMRRFAFTSPAFLKKRFSSYWKQRGEEYQGDLNKAFSGFTNVLFNKWQKQKVAALNSREALYDFQREIQEKIKKYRDPATTPEEKLVISEEIKSIIKGIAEKTTKDTQTQNTIQNVLKNSLYSDPAHTILQDDTTLPLHSINQLIPSTALLSNIDILGEAAKLDREEAFDFLKEEKNREEEAKKQKEYAEKIREQEKEGKFNPEFAIRQVIRGSVGKIEQRAIADHLATSSRNFGKFVESINREIGNLANPNDVSTAMNFLKDRLSENDMINILRIAEKDADKNNNLSQLGWMKFDPILNKSRATTEHEREEILKKHISGWSYQKKIAKTNPIVFDFYTDNAGVRHLKDKVATKVLFRSIDFNKVINTSKILADIDSDISTKTRNLLKDVNNMPYFRPFVDPAQQIDYDTFTQGL